MASLWTLPGPATLLSALGTLSSPANLLGRSGVANGGVEQKEEEEEGDDAAQISIGGPGERHKLTQLHALLRQLSAMSVIAPSALVVEEAVAVRKDDPRKHTEDTGSNGASAGTEEGRQILAAAAAEQRDHAAWAPVLKARMTNRIRVRLEDTTGSGRPSCQFVLYQPPLRSRASAGSEDATAFTTRPIVITNIHLPPADASSPGWRNTLSSLGWVPTRLRMPSQKEPPASPTAPVTYIKRGIRCILHLPARSGKPVAGETASSSSGTADGQRRTDATGSSAGAGGSAESAANETDGSGRSWYTEVLLFRLYVRESAVEARGTFASQQAVAGPEVMDLTKDDDEDGAGADDKKGLAMEVDAQDHGRNGTGLEELYGRSASVPHDLREVAPGTLFLQVHTIIPDSAADTRPAGEIGPDGAPAARGKPANASTLANGQQQQQLQVQAQAQAQASAQQRQSREQALLEQRERAVRWTRESVLAPLLPFFPSSGTSGSGLRGEE